MIQNFQDEVCFVLDTMKGMTMAAKNDSVSLAAFTIIVLLQVYLSVFP